MSNVGQAVLTIGGAAIGFAIGGVPGAQLGYLLGSAAGSYVFPTELPTIRGPTLDNLNVQVSTIGNPIPQLWGRFGIGGNVVWSSGLIPHVTKKKVGGKGAPSQTVENTSYTIDVAIAGPAGVVGGMRRMWFDAICVYDKRPQLDDESTADFHKRLAATAQIDEILVVYPGSETQLPDPTIESYLGVGEALAYRGLSYIVLTGLDTTKWGNRLPNVVIEWYTDGEVDETDCSGYSPGELYPWMYDSGSAHFDYWTNDPRSPDNNHVYSAGAGSPLQEQDSLVTAKAELVAAFDGRSFLVSEAYGRDHGDNVYIQGYAPSASPTGFMPCEEHYAPLDYVTLYLQLNNMHRTPSSRYGCTGAGGPTWITVPEPSGPCDELEANGGMDFAVSLYDGGGYFYARVTTGADLGGVFEGVSTIGGGLDPNGDCGVEPANLWLLNDSRIAVSRTTQPSACPAGGVPLVSGYCIVDGVITREVTYTPVAGTFKTLQEYAQTGDFGVVTQYPVGPCLRSDHPDYNNQAFWEAAYAEQLAAGAPLVVDPVYGTLDGYPSLISAAYERSCVGEVIDTPCVPVATIVADICRACGLSDSQFDVTDLTSCVEGYVVPQPMSGRDMIAPLMTFGLFDAVESQGVLKFVERGHAHVATLTEDDLAAHGPGQERPTVVEVRRQLEESLPRTLRLRYASPERDYEQGEQKQSRATVQATDDVTISLPIAMSDERAAQLVEILLYNAWIARTTYQAVTTRARLPLEPTDCILLPVDGYLERMRIVEASYATGGLYRLALQKDDDGSYTSTAVPAIPARSGTGGSAGDNLICGAEGILLDIPGLRTQDTDAGYYFVARSLCGNWVCAELYRSPDGGETFQWVGRAENEGTIGTIRIADMDGASPDLLELDLESGGTLDSVTDAQLDAGMNLAAVGADGRWCLIQYNVATLDSGDVWILQVARTGLYGTAEHLASVGEGDRFVLLADAAVVRIGESPSAIGVEKDFKVVACGELIDNVSSFAFTTQGLSYVPPTAPQHVISCVLSSPPDDPLDGDCYLVPVDTGATGAWDGHEGEVCCWRDLANGWECSAPPTGVPIYCDESGGYVTPDPSGGFVDGGPWTPAIPPLPEDTGGAFDPDTTYGVVHDGTAYFKVLLDDLRGSGLSLERIWRFDPLTTAADPGTGDFRVNHATLASVTAVYFNSLTARDFDADVLLDTLEDGYRFYIQQETDADRAALFEVNGTPTDNGGWWTVPVTIVRSFALYEANARCTAFFLLAASGSGTPGSGGGYPAPLGHARI